ncbi:hypothetical protein BZG36_02434 [Bifiguratus adelaidae]|uniref:Uncharacterized protein n=1 Tax=Bifiguratus adelaidae TaxID=1938954 RepID=A0A261Y3K9_9FUNG|nr:hypothetical protein BZG36_02434 [Bifiguratus adelaidae]
MEVLASGMPGHMEESSTDRALQHDTDEDDSLLLLDPTGTIVLDCISLSQTDTFSLDSFADLIADHHVEVTPIHSHVFKAFILARVKTYDPVSSRYFYSYYNAWHLNKVLFRTQTLNGKRLIHRVNVRDPLNKCEIVSVEYFMTRKPKDEIMPDGSKVPRARLSLKDDQGNEVEAGLPHPLLLSAWIPAPESRRQTQPLNDPRSPRCTARDHAQPLRSLNDDLPPTPSPLLPLDDIPKKKGRRIRPSLTSGLSAQELQALTDKFPLTDFMDRTFDHSTITESELADIAVSLSPTANMTSSPKACHSPKMTTVNYSEHQYCAILMSTDAEYLFSFVTRHIFRVNALTSTDYRLFEIKPELSPEPQWVADQQLYTQGTQTPVDPQSHQQYSHQLAPRSRDDMERGNLPSEIYHGLEYRGARNQFYRRIRVQISKFLTTLRVHGTFHDHLQMLTRRRHSVPELPVTNLGYVRRGNGAEQLNTRGFPLQDRRDRNPELEMAVRSRDEEEAKSACVLILLLIGVVICASFLGIIIGIGRGFNR